MNNNTYPAGSVRIAARDLHAGVPFIYDYMGGNRTVYRAVNVRDLGARTVIEYRAGDTFSVMSVPSLSTLVLV